MNAAMEIRAEKMSGTGAGAGSGMEMCSVYAGGRMFGVPVVHILEILGRPTTQPVPLAPSFVGGLVHYRGEVLTAVSLRKLLGMDAYSEASDVLVFEGRSGYYGLMVDAVGEVIMASPESFEVSPSTLDSRSKALFAGACKLESGLMVLLAPERLDPMRLSA